MHLMITVLGSPAALSAVPEPKIAIMPRVPGSGEAVGESRPEPGVTMTVQEPD
jgi:hypothetical protein